MPQDWTIQDHDSGVPEPAGPVLMSSPGGIDVQLLVEAAPYGLGAYTTENIDEIRRMHELHEDAVLTDLGEPKPTVVAGSPAYAVVYAMRVKGEPKKAWQVWTVKNKKAYLVQLDAWEHSFDTYLQIAEEMVASMEIR